MNLLCRLSFRREDQNKRQIPGSVHGSPASGVGERISLQPLHHNKKKGRTGNNTRSIRETG